MLTLREMVEKKRTLFAKGADTWQEAVRMACKTLEADGTVEASYAEDIIQCVTEHGPYIVLLPGYAMPHSKEGAVGVHATGISFMKLETPVSFKPGDPEMDASVFFTLAAADPDEHIRNMKRLFKILTNEELVEELPRVESDADLLALADKYGLA